jgi:poly(beta-D-mannuronate) lyase
VEHNLFERCDGEIEIISNKSCENIYRFNTFLECAGMFTLRHGNRCRVEGNFFLGRHRRGSGGIRVIGEDHIILNNYIDGVEEGGFWVTAGIPDSPLVGYFQARNCLIAFNTVVDSRGPAVDLSAGLGGNRRTLLPENITVANNFFSLTSGTLLKGTEGKGFKWIGNMASASPSAEEQTHFRLLEPNLERAKDGLWRPAMKSPMRGAAAGDFHEIKTDIDGQQRNGRFDVGCDQIAEGAVVNRPLNAAEVGPSWLDRSEKGLKQWLTHD